MNMLKTTLLVTGLFSSATLLANNADQAERVNEMVNLVPDNNAMCPFSGGMGGYLYHQKINDDATLSEFSIPNGYSLVVTVLDQGNLTIETDTNFVSLASTGQSTALILHDVVIKPGVRICAFGGNIHGHLERTR